MAGFQFRVRDLMSRDVKTLNENDSLSLADDVMKMGRIRHLPVCDEAGTVVGVVSQRDLFRGALGTALGYGERAKQKIMETMKVKDVMRGQVHTVAPDEHVGKAAQLLLEHKIGCLPVIDDGELVGIVSESDYVALFARRDD